MLEVELRGTLLNEALGFALAGDFSWLDDLDELVRLYDIREDNANEWWTTPAGSVERVIWDEVNAPYIAALNVWERVWKMVVGNHEKQNFITYQMAADFIKLKNFSTD